MPYTNPYFFESQVPCLAYDRDARMFVIHTGGPNADACFTLPRDLPTYASNIQLFAQNYAAQWKRVHTLSENLYRRSREYQEKVLICKVAAPNQPHQMDQYRREAAHLLESIRVDWKDWAGQLDLLPWAVKESPVKVLCHLPKCINPLLRSLATGNMGKDLEAAIELSEAISEWLLITLHFADQVLEEYFNGH